MSRFYSLIYTCLFFLLLTGPLGAATYYISPSGIDDEGRDGLSPATAWASLRYACGRVPNGENTIRMAAGTYVAVATATPPRGVTIEGAGTELTTIIASTDWMLTDKIRPGDQVDYDLQNYLISDSAFETEQGGGRGGSLTIRGIRFESPEEALIDGAIYLRDIDDVLLEDLDLENFRWAGVNLVADQRVIIRRCDFLNTNRIKVGSDWSGNIRVRVLRDAEIYDCTFANDVDGEGQFQVGYKGTFHTNVKLYDCDFRSSGGGFDIEAPFEEEYGFEIYNNQFDRTISIPKSGDQPAPQTRGFEYTFWLHDNVITDSYAIEGPRNYLRVSNNFFNIGRRKNGRIYTQFGSSVTRGPIWIHDNVAVGVDRSFIWKNQGRLDSVYIYHNTVYYGDAEDRSAAMLDAFFNTTGWQVYNNIFVADPADPRPIGVSVNCETCPQEDVPVIQNNLFVNVEGRVPEGNFTEQDPGLTLSGPQPDPFFRPQDGEAFVVDRGAVLPFVDDRTFFGAAPDIGAYEFEPATSVGGAASGAPADEALVTVYPNPTTDHLYLQATERLTVTLIGTLGEVVLRSSVDTGSGRLELGDLAPGHYWLHATAQGGRSQWHRVIVAGGFE